LRHPVAAPCLALFLLVSGAPAARSQSGGQAPAMARADTAGPPTVLEAGTLVRVTQRSGSPRQMTGALMGADTVLSLLPTGGAVRWEAAWPAVERVEVRRIRHDGGTRTGRGAAIGAAVGVTVAALALVGAGSTPCGECGLDPRGAVAVVAIPGILVSTGIGALVGHAVHGHEPRWHWEAVPLPVRTPPSTEVPAGPPPSS
jgi:hypothetical protein